jgi:hypothetical protein
MNKSKATATLAIFAIVTAVALITASTIIIPAFALTRYFNCTTGIANKTGKLTIDDVNMCYDKKFPSKTDNSATTRSIITSQSPMFQDSSSNSQTSQIIVPTTTP